MVLEGHEAVAVARQLIGATNPVEAAPGSIRGDFALEVTFNMVHGSDSDESAEREIGIRFPELVGRGAARVRVTAEARASSPNRRPPASSRLWLPVSESSSGGEF